VTPGDVDRALLKALDPEALEPLGEPVVARPVVDQVTERLVTAVALGVYSPGQQLPAERELAPMLGVSRTTAREALQRLTDAGYLEVRRGRHGGYFVLADWGPSSAEMVRRHLVPNWTAFEALFDARGLLEPLIAGTAAARRTDADCEAITLALADYEAAGSRDASRRADERLHRAVAEATHNPVLLALSTQIRSKVSLGLGAEPFTEELRSTANQQHLDLAHAVVDGSAEGAAAVAAQHFAISATVMRDLVRRVQDTEDAR
jgi:GntR family transcriptional repressor for pyruvate dehydrogenase complex